MRVVDRVLQPLGVDPRSTWFTDVVDRYFVKSGGGTGQQGDASRLNYAPFARAAGLPVAALPARPSIEGLIRLAVEEHAARLRAELTDARAPAIVTLGEEARRVVLALSDGAAGSPTEPLSLQRFANGAATSYGEAGYNTIGGRGMAWRSLAHPGQRGAAWTALHDAWIARLSDE